MAIAAGSTDHEPVPGGGEAGPGRWSRLASLGLAMAAAGPILFIVAALVWGLDTDDLGFFGVTAVLAIAGALLVRQRRTWMKVLGIVLGLAVGAALFWTLFGLATPATFFDFLPGVLVIPGVIVGLVAGIASIRAAKRSDPAPAAGERRAMGLILTAVGALAVLSAVISIASRETVSDDEAADADFVVDLKDFEFDADSYDATGDTKILVKNSDPFMHTFTVDELGIDVTLNGGSEKLITIPDESGSYVVYCEPHTSDKEDPSEDDMTAELNVS